MHWEIHWHMFLLYPLKVHMYLCTFWHPHFRLRNVPMSTSFKHCTREILVLVCHMLEEGLELCKFKLSTMKAFFGWRDSPVKMSHTSFPPPTNNLAIFLLAQFDEDFLDFFTNVPKIKEMLYNWLSKIFAFLPTLFPHPFSNGHVSVWNERLNNHLSGEQICDCFLECHEFDSRAASSLVSLESKLK